MMLHSGDGVFFTDLWFFDYESSSTPTCFQAKVMSCECFPNGRFVFAIKLWLAKQLGNLMPLAFWWPPSLKAFS